MGIVGLLLGFLGLAGLGSLIGDGVSLPSESGSLFAGWSKQCGLHTGELPESQVKHIKMQSLQRSHSKTTGSLKGISAIVERQVLRACNLAVRPGALSADD